MIANKYLNYDQIKSIIGDLVVPENFRPMSQDSYNETLIAEAIKKTGKSEDLMLAAMNISIVGAGNQKYGNFAKGENVIEVANLLASVGVRLRLPQGAVLKEDELTVGRLCRFFRHNTREYLRVRRIPTYQWRKYSDHKAEMNCILFRGAEYLSDLSDEEKQEQEEVHARMDRKMNTSFAEKLRRIRQAQAGLLLSIDT